jgi:hypothetical protein
MEQKRMYKATIREHGDTNEGGPPKREVSVLAISFADAERVVNAAIESGTLKRGSQMVGLYIVPTIVLGQTEAG